MTNGKNPGVPECGAMGEGIFLARESQENRYMAGWLHLSPGSRCRNVRMGSLCLHASGDMHLPRGKRLFSSFLPVLPIVSGFSILFHRMDLPV